MLQPLSLFAKNSPHPLDGQVFEAIEGHDIPHLQALFAAGARPNAIHPSQGHTALGGAIQQEHGEMVQVLMDHGADLNATGRHGETALMAAASQSNLALVTLFLEKGALVNAMSDDGDTALCLAAGATQWGVMAAKTGAEPQLQGIVRRTEAGLEQLRPNDEDQVLAVVERLLAAGAQLNRLGCSATPVMEATRYGQLKLLAWLLQRGAQPNLPAKDGQTALEIAKLYNQTRALTLLEAHQFGDDATPSEFGQLVAV